ncbi:MAG: hypothetical protein M1338_01335 [Patescibacteria group bacterium]|nr:hypothetical protein [Patescibacteria group bacterium]
MKMLCLAIAITAMICVVVGIYMLANGFKNTNRYDMAAGAVLIIGGITLAYTLDKENKEHK